MQRPEWLEVLEGGIDQVPGVTSGVGRAGLKREGPDLALLLSERLASAAMVATTNRFRAAPVTVSQRRLSSGCAQAIVVNAGNANACTGEQGLRDAEEMCALAGEALGVPKEYVVVASTGVIGVALPMERIRAAIEAAGRAMGKHGQEATRAMMTTDKMVKQMAVRFPVGRGRVTLAGMTKGAGMIAPNMATMLCFLFTDAVIGSEALSLALRGAVELSFNSITIDGDTSTNDMVVALANGMSGLDVGVGPGMERFELALRYLCVELAKMMVRDAEGATKTIEVLVKGAGSAREAKQAAMTVANSVLVKTAMFGADPNWGRIAAALGRCGVELQPQRVSIALCGAPVFTAGAPVEFDAGALRQAMSGKEITVTIDLGSGNAEATVWTSDLSTDYVNFNSAYTT